MAAPVLLYLCCGSGGGADEFERAGFRVIGVDIKRRAEWRHEYIEADIRQLRGDSLPGVAAVFATTPCTEMSQCWAFQKSRVPRPQDGVELFNHAVRIASETNAPIVLENVRGAQQFVGQAVAHAGSFYLWGDVPPLLPTERYLKGIWKVRHKQEKVKHTRSPILRGQIPAELARVIAEYLYRLVELRNEQPFPTVAS